MRKIELQTVEDINVVCIDGQPTSLQYTKDDMNFMLDDLAASFPSRAGTTFWLSSFRGHVPRPISRANL